ncbi:MAG: nitroreductase family protein [Eubacteriaceae bacterium]|jgi:hypothetical protein|nr:nitroreductase family protein [Eubacteriaceae bacterium]
MEHYLREAVKIRESRRAFQKLPLRKQDSDRMRLLISRYNQEARLKMRLVEIDEELFRHYKNGVSLFKDVVNYIALVGANEDRDMEDKIGYYGELLVLEATAIDLGTCWITRTFDRAGCEERLELEEGYRLAGVIAIGYPAPQKPLREAAIQRLCRTIWRKADILRKSGAQEPEWVSSGIKAVMLAPSRPPSYPFAFELTEDSRIRAEPLRENRRIELGIAMVHFEIGAAVGRWYKEEGVWTFAVSHS